MSVLHTPCTLTEAFARQEGFYVDGSRTGRNHNPGAIRWGNFARLRGATHGDRPDEHTALAVFPIDEMGFAAYRDVLSVRAHIEDGKLLLGYLGATLGQVVNRFAPPSENDADGYLRNVCEWTGHRPEEILNADML